MSYPKTQWVIGIKRGSEKRGWRTSYFYGEKLGALVMMRVRPNEEFIAIKLTSGKPQRGVRSGTADRYALDKP